MKLFFVVVCSFVLSAISNTNAASLRRSKRQLVPKEFANINIENYLKNDRAVQFQLKCIVYDGPCDRIGKYLKVTIPELLTNQCQSCEPAQRQRAGRLVQHIQQKFPKEWSDAIQKFQGGQVKKEDADKLESLLGVKLDSKLVAQAPSTTTTTSAPSSSSSTTTPTTTIAPSSTAATEVTSSSTAVPPVSSSTSTSTTAPLSSEAPASISTTTTTTVSPAESSTTSKTPASSVAPQTPSSSVAPPEVSSSTSTTTAPVSSSSVAPPTSETPKPVTEVSSSTTSAPSSSEPTKA